MYHDCELSYATHDRFMLIFHYLVIDFFLLLFNNVNKLYLEKKLESIKEYFYYKINALFYSL